MTICERSLRDYQGWLGLLRADIHSVAASIGTPRKAANLKAALEIGRRLMIAGYEDRFQVKSPSDVAKLFMAEMMALDQEELWVASLDTKNRVVKISKVYRGSVNNAQIRIGEIFKDAIPAMPRRSWSRTTIPPPIARPRLRISSSRGRLWKRANSWTAVSLRERGLVFPS